MDLILGESPCCFFNDREFDEWHAVELRAELCFVATHLNGQREGEQCRKIQSS